MSVACRASSSSENESSLYIYAWKPGMGFEPMSSGSAARRLNGSATPAHTILRIIDYYKSFLKRHIDMANAFSFVEYRQRRLFIIPLLSYLKIRGKLHVSSTHL